ncbi:MAG: type I methionyl aminopeptidase, partial [Candidatus Vogelbacteria bacterium]|nr:type I methionyl aminopeptidase [Candidatus Vogelbacteria bacterium]
IVGLDLGIKHEGLFTDMAVTVGIGEVDKKAKRLMEVTSQALEFGISVAKAGATTGDIGYAIESFVRPYKYGIVRELSGHGVGHKIHEDPYVPNYGKRGAGTKLKSGMVLALEPMINEGSDDIILGDDDFTYKTRDGSRSAHFEKTILITDGEPEILTP